MSHALSSYVIFLRLNFSR